YRAHGTRQAVLHAAHGGVQHTDFVTRVHLNAVREVATGDAVEMLAGLHQRTHDIAPEHDADADHQKETEKDGHAHGGQRTVERTLGVGKKLGTDLGLLLVEIVNRLLEACRARLTELTVHEIERDVVVRFERLHHRVDAVVDIGLIGTDNAYSLAALGTHVAQRAAKLIELASNVVETLLGVGEFRARTLAQCVIAALLGFLLVAGSRKQADPHGHHFRTNARRELRAVILLLELLHRLHVLPQEIPTHGT